MSPILPPPKKWARHTCIWNQAYPGALCWPLVLSCPWRVGSQGHRQVTQGSLSRGGLCASMLPERPGRKRVGMQELLRALPQRQHRTGGAWQGRPRPLWLSSTWEAPGEPRAQHPAGSWYFPVAEEVLEPSSVIYSFLSGMAGTKPSLLRAGPAPCP